VPDRDPTLSGSLSLVLRKRLLIPLGLLLALAGAGVPAWRSGRLDPLLDSLRARLGWPARNAEAPAAPPAPPEAVPAPSPAPPPPAPVPAHPAPPANLAILSGRVVRESNGMPLAGVRVRAFLSGERAAEIPPLYTGEDGSFQLPVPCPVTLDALLVDAGPETAARKMTLGKRLRPGSRTSIRIPVTRGATVSGRVLDEQGRPVPHARVRGWCRGVAQVDRELGALPDRQVTADEEGRFSVSALGPDFVLSASGPGGDLRPAERLTGRLERGRLIHGIELRVGSANSLQGWVLAPDGSGLEEVAVRMRDDPQSAPLRTTGMAGVFRAGPPPGRVLTREDGSFEISGLQNHPYRLEVDQPGFAPWMGSAEAGGAPSRIRLDPGLSLTGRVLAETGDQGVEGAALILKEGGRSLVGMSAKDGRFSFPGLAPFPDGTLLIRAEGHAWRVVHPVSLREEAAPPLEIRLQPARGLAGRVLEKDGRPVADAEVRLAEESPLDGAESHLSAPPPWPGTLRAPVTHTDARGRFHFRNLPDRRFLVTVTHPENSDWKMERRHVPSGEVLEMDLDPLFLRKVVLAGEVRDALTGRPLEEFQAIPERPGESAASAPAREFHEGRFDIEALEPGEWALAVQAPGYAATFLPAREYPLGVHSFQVGLYPARSLELRVRDQEGNPLARPRIRFRDPEGRLLRAETGNGFHSSDLRGDDQGAVRVSGLPARRIQALVRLSEDPGREWVFPLDLAREPESTAELVIPRTPPCKTRPFGLVLCGNRLPGIPGSWTAPTNTARLDRLTCGNQAWLLSGKAQVTVRAEDGSVLAVRQWGPGMAPMLRLQVPEGPWSLEIEAPGYLPFRGNWPGQTPPPAVWSVCLPVRFQP